MELDAIELDQIEKAKYKCPFPFEETTEESCTLWQQAVGAWFMCLVFLVWTLIVAYIAIHIICIGYVVIGVIYVGLETIRTIRTRWFLSWNLNHPKLQPHGYVQAAIDILMMESDDEW